MCAEGIEQHDGAAARREVAVGYGLVLAGCLVLYVVTCSPGLLWQDSGMFQYRVWQQDIEGRLGLALAHPLYVLIGIVVKYIPLGGFVFRVNLISAVAGAFTVANVFLLLRLWLGKLAPAVIGALNLAFSWTIWQHACIAEVYTLYTALFVAELVVLLQYFRNGKSGYLVWLGLLNGLAIANHMWAIIPLACYVVLLAALVGKKKVAWRVVAAAGGLWLIGASPYLYLIGKDIIVGGDGAATIRSALFGGSWAQGVLNTQLTWRVIKENVMFIIYSFPTPNILLFFVGLVLLRKLAPSRGFGWVLGILTGLFLVFAFRYDVPDRYAFFMPFYCLVAVLIGVGAHGLLQVKRCRILAGIIMGLTLLNLPVYAMTPSIAKERFPVLSERRQIPYRDSYKWFLQPWRCGYRGCEAFAEEALATVERDGVIYADGTTVYPLWFHQQLNDRRRDVVIVSGHGSFNNLGVYGEAAARELLAERAVYVVSPLRGYCPDFLLEEYGSAKVGVLYRVIEKSGAE